ncbi:hypothetical protein HG535_0F02090 [Zygotorulaspora mrakii]|uniref:Kri1-like C-terminal domain-containing protein n=1 Tax=Zygotorulaspora mrakii TaxID=42260 RepID=A0A7H9B4T4_ZYGMR|nr:uncharacterized protein HG535_0F02090 [Zygotorulaspora mrakii]QLG73698.1 hypothetical protein HG535_0F02090 [Zygotorulaspora mrakii]
MPRKKSSAKKARETAVKEAKQVHVKIGAQEDKETELPTIETPKEISDASGDESSSEEEDDYGELITEEVEEGIQKVLKAIRANDKEVLFNPKVRFFHDAERTANANEKNEKHKPIYLKDYHRMNILAGNTFAEDEEQEESTIDGKQSYVDQQKEEKTKLLDEIKNAFDEGVESDQEDEDFLKKKTPSKKVEKSNLNLPDPAQNQEKFLDEFINNQAWIPRKGDKVVSLDHDSDMQEDDDEFEDAVEQFETAYNFRYEDPNSADIVSYARNQATARRAASKSRRKKREEEREIKNKEMLETERSIQKKKTEKVHKLTDVLEQLKKEYGADIDEAMIKKITNTLLNNEYKEEDWNEVLSGLFNEEFYEQKGKPTWDDDDEVMADFYEDQDIEEAEDVDVEKEEEDDIQDTDKHQDEKSSNKSRKEKKKGKMAEKKEKKNLRALVENAVEDNKLAIIDEVEKSKEERKSRARSKEEQDLKFRYREVSPESFGLTTKEIFAADDAQLNQFIGLKKFAPYRPKEQRMRDKRKVTKAKRLREWRKEVFKNENGMIASDGNTDGSIIIPVDSDSKTEKKVHKARKHKSSS